MKKSNVTVIATVLIALHILVFAIVIGTRKEKSKPSIPEPTPKPTHAILNDPSPASALGFELPGLLPEEPVKPVEVATMPAAQPRESIAVPGSREGYLRSDRPNRRTSTVYPKLVGDPYTGAIVVDARTGKILYEDRAGAYAYPASVTKLMTLLVVLDQVEKGVVHLDDKVQITRAGMGVGGSQAYLDVRESGLYSVDDLLKALVIHSANDTARILGIHVAGSKEAFVDMMNQKARELGMNSTTFHSEHGLPPSDGSQPDISTPYDIALLSMAVMRHPETLQYSSTKLAYLPASPLRKEPFMLATRNDLAGKAPYPGCDGLKTGYHGMGGWSLAATAERNGDRVVAILLGSPDKNTRNDTARKLLDKGFQALAK